jgi:hypothetical protein
VLLCVGHHRGQIKSNVDGILRLYKKAGDVMKLFEVGTYEVYRLLAWNGALVEK